MLRLFFGRRIKIFLSLTFAGLVSSGVAAAQPVDLELALLVDVSGSVTNAEFNLQKEGYAAAFESQEVKNALQGKTIAVMSTFWAGGQETVIPWREVTASSADALASQFRGIRRSSLNVAPNQTSVGSAIAFGRRSFDNNGFESSRKVIDISGNGVANGGLLPVSGQRDLAIQSGITINGIVIGNETDAVQFYQREVVGGTGSFLSQASDFSTFAQVVKKKLVREISAATRNAPLSLATRSVRAAKQLTLNPGQLTHIVDTTAVLTATVTEGSFPIVNVPVVFTVNFGPNTGANGLCSPKTDCTTDDNGQVTFSYPGINGVGVDAVQATIGALQRTSTVTWIDSRAASSGSGDSNSPATSASDSDFDGLSDADEARLGTDPNDPDTDDDGLLDGQEAGPGGTGTDPRKRDTDNDDLPDGLETSASGPGTSPVNPDTDGDGILDGVELSHTPTPTNPLSWDTDGDGRGDGDEDANHNGRVDPGETDPRIADGPVDNGSNSATGNDPDNATQPDAGSVQGTEGPLVLSGVNGGLGALGWPFALMLGLGAVIRRRGRRQT